MESTREAIVEYGWLPGVLVSLLLLYRTEPQAVAAVAFFGLAAGVPFVLLGVMLADGDNS